MLANHGLVLSYEAADDLNHIIQHAGGEPWVRANEHSLIHDAVSACQGSNDTKSTRGMLAQRYKCRLTHQVPTEQHSVANLPCFKALNEIAAGKRSRLLDQHHKTEP